MVHVTVCPISDVQDQFAALWTCEIVAKAGIARSSRVQRVHFLNGGSQSIERSAAGRAVALPRARLEADLQRVNLLKFNVS